MNKLASALTGTQGQRVALCDVSVRAVLQDLFAETTIEQTYRNDEDVNIEAVYTFALPVDAVLLELVVEIGGRVLNGVVVKKRDAEEAYEDAVAAGDAAVMLQAIEPGLYTMNVGNLLPKETAKIGIRYAVLYRWTGDRLRFFLPTTVAPRYGVSRHQPQQIPEASLMVENLFSVQVELLGTLRDAQLACPSHAVEMMRTDEKVVLSLRAPKAVMDRDFVLNVKLGQARRSVALCGADGDGLAAVASFQPFFPGLQQARPLNLAIVIDCSGSMQGDSIGQAKQALDGILDGLQAHDRIALIAFGTTTKLLAAEPLPCTAANVAKARQFAQALEADLGGTEIGGALHQTYAVAGGSGPADVFLVTDGEVADWSPVVDEAKRSGHRVFTVGVGSAVSEAFVRALAACTGGECELVSPGEGMAERVVRHFERMRAPRASRVHIHWPEGAVDITPATLGAVFEGDTVLASARFDRIPAQGSAILEVHTDQGEVSRQQLVFPPSLPSSTPDGVSTVARIAAGLRLKTLDATAGLQTALCYRLISPWTHWLVVAERSESDRAHVLPELRKVPQTLAAGWGGTGRVVRSMRQASFVAAPAAFYESLSASSDHGFSFDVAGAPAPTRHAGLPEPHERLLELVNADASRVTRAGAVALLQQSGLERYLGESFQLGAHAGFSRDFIAAMILTRLLSGQLGAFLSDDVKAALASLEKLERETSSALGELGRSADQLLVGLGQARAGGILERLPDTEFLNRLMQTLGMLEHLDKVLRRSEEQIERESAAREKDQRRAKAKAKAKV